MGFVDGEFDRISWSMSLWRGVITVRFRLLFFWLTIQGGNFIGFLTRQSRILRVWQRPLRLDIGR